MKFWQKILCKWNHKWEFVTGRWASGHENQISLITRKCVRCNLHQEYSHMKSTMGINFLEKEWTP